MKRVFAPGHINKSAVVGGAPELWRAKIGGSLWERISVFHVAARCISNLTHVFGAVLTFSAFLNLFPRMLLCCHH